MSEMSEDQRKAMMEKLQQMSPEELKEFQKKQCIFCQISSGKIPAKKVYEDNSSFAVLDINPANRGHILLLPKEHYAIMPQIPDEEIKHLGIVAKKLSQAALKSLKAEGTTIFIANGTAAGQRAQHFMIHVIPRVLDDGLLKIPQKQISSEQLDKIRESLLITMNKMFGIKKEVVIEHKKDEHEQHDNDTKPEIKEHHKTEHSIPHKTEKKKTEQKKKVSKEKKSKSTKDDVSLDDIASLFQ